MSSASSHRSTSEETEPCYRNSSDEILPPPSSGTPTDYSGEEFESGGEAGGSEDYPFDRGDEVGGGGDVATVQKTRPSYLNFVGGTGLIPSNHPFDMGVIKKLDSFLEESIISEILEEEKLKTFLRIRSTSAVMDEQVIGVKTRSFKNKNKNKVLEIKNDTTVIAYPVQKSVFHQNGLKAEAKQTEFNFSKVLGPECAQSTVFEECMTPIIDKFLKNENCLVFTYGATNSGKTYTLQGHGEQYGILPRTLYAIFSQIQDRVLKTGDIMPHLYQSFRKLSPKEIQDSERSKERVLAEAALLKTELSNLNYSHLSNKSGSTVNLVGAKAFHEMNYALFADTTLFSVWVSFAELYNERVYDLLETVHMGKNKRRKERKLMQDSNGFVYVKDLTEVHVTSEDEALKIFLAGRQHLQFAATQMNQKSSRSHSFFTLRVITLGVGAGPMLYPKSVHRLTFCDLAGMERVHQTENEGARLKESSNINASLTVLLKVIRILREKQAHKTRSNMIETIPFRESKLTHIFKSYFTSSTHICMIVNVNPDPAMANSTLQVLNNSAIASNVIVFKPIESIQPSNKSQKGKNGVKEADVIKKGTKCVKFAEHKNKYLNQFDSTTSSLASSDVYRRSSDSSLAGSNSDDEASSIIVRNRLLQDRVAVLEKENYDLFIESQTLRRKLERCENEKENLREESVKLLTEQNRLWSTRFKEAKIQEDMYTQRRLSLMKHQLLLSPGTKCSRNYLPPVVDMDSILEEVDNETEVEDQHTVTKQGLSDEPTSVGVDDVSDEAQACKIEI